MLVIRQRITHPKSFLREQVGSFGKGKQHFAKRFPIFRVFFFYFSVNLNLGID